MGIIENPREKPTGAGKYRYITSLSIKVGTRTGAFENPFRFLLDLSGTAFLELPELYGQNGTLSIRFPPDSSVFSKQ